MKHLLSISLLLLLSVKLLAMETQNVTGNEVSTDLSTDSSSEIKKIMNSDLNQMMAQVSRLDDLHHNNIHAMLSSGTPEKIAALNAAGLQSEPGIFKKKGEDLKKRMAERNRKLKCILCALCPFTCGLSLIGCCCHKD